MIELGDYADGVTAERVRRTIQGFKDTRSEQHVLFEQRLTVKALANGKTALDEAMGVFEKAQGSYSRISRPQIVTDVKGKTGTPYLRVVATQEHDADVSGAGGDFSFYELGAPLLVDGGLNPEVPLSRVREYVWFTETGETYQPESAGVHPDFLGRSASGVSYFFAFDAGAPTVLDRRYLATIPAECGAESYVIYADTCVLSDHELAAHAITFKKIPRDITRL